MDRRNFFRLFGAGVAGVALEQAIPFGRVWSFPTTIVLPERELAHALPLTLISPEALEALRRNLTIKWPDTDSLFAIYERKSY